MIHNVDFAIVVRRKLAFELSVLKNACSTAVGWAGLLPLLAACSGPLLGDNQGSGALAEQAIGSGRTGIAAGTTNTSIFRVDSLTPCLRRGVPSFLPVTFSLSSQSVPSRSQDFVLPTWLSLLAYRDSKTVLNNLRRVGFQESEVSSFDFFRPVQGSFSSSQGFVAQSSRGRFVVFRGSNSPVDWISNFKTGLVQRPELFGTKAAVHQGFMELTEFSFDEVFRRLESAKGETAKLPVWVVGHSLGGAQAAIFALMAAQRVSRLVRL